MARISSRQRLTNEVNAGSMADIAFLLLIFFLVATTITEDTGILVKLPPWDDTMDPIDVNQDHVLTILVNHENHIFAEGQTTEIKHIKSIATGFIETKLHEFRNTKKSPVISINCDKKTKYDTYINVYNELKAAYNELWDDLSQQLYEKDYTYLSIQQKKITKERLPLVISEAEPSDFGG